MKRRNLLKQFCLALAFLNIFLPVFSQGARQKGKTIYYFNPSWSPDGSRVLFESTLRGGSYIYSISKDGTDLKQLTHDLSGQPCWSPAGNEIVYYRQLNKHLQLFIKSIPGGSERRLVSSSSQDYGPNWSRNGKIAFMATQTPGHISHSVYTVNTDGTGLKRITDTSYDCMQPIWSPDGKEILFIRAQWTSKTYNSIAAEEMEQIKHSNEIMIMDTDGNQANGLPESTKGYANAKWTADGKGIYLKQDTDSSATIFRFNIRENKKDTVCKINQKIGSFDVSPDGSYMVFECTVNKENSLRILNMKTGRLQILIGRK